MVEKALVVRMPQGLHARPATQFIKISQTFQSSIQVCKAAHCVDGKSILGLMSLAVANEESITLKIDGTDEKVALETLERLLTEGVS